MTSWKRTIRFRLTMGFIAIIVVTNVLVSLVTVLNISRVLLEEVQTRVRMNLNSAQGIYDSNVKAIAQFLTAVTLDGTISEGLGGGELDRVGRLLSRVRIKGGMDILTLLGADGRVLYRTRNPEARGDDLSPNPLVRQSLRSRRRESGTVLVPRRDLERESPDLAARARLDTLPTPAARPGAAPTQSDGMAIAAVVPLLDERSRLVGLLYGANLVNRQFGIVDEIKNEAFHNQRYGGKEIGTATIFQGDLRIATNVMTAEGQRAIGTRMSRVVYERVIEKGEIWADRAFVVNAWYITAYGPIRDPDRRTIGSLYVGLLEAPFVEPRKQILYVFLGIMAATTLVSLLLIFFVTKLILRPIGQVVSMAKQVIAGDLSARVEGRAPGEMGLLCLAVNSMADAVREREEQLKAATNRQLLHSEKLASIGRLAAGIAHEINNPLTGVLTFSHLLRKKAVADQDRQDLDLIIRETTRVREIVRGLLDFARGNPPSKAWLSINDVLRQTVKLVRSQKEFHKVTIEEHLDDTIPELYGDKNQLQQVMLNISLNACEAMIGGGTLRIVTGMGDEKSPQFVRIVFSDTGHGISEEHRGKIFDPFFTTKPVGKGTGLGLSVSYGIVQAHGGAIEVESVVGQGASFTIALPVGGNGQPPDDRERIGEEGAA